MIRPLGNVQILKVDRAVDNSDIKLVGNMHLSGTKPVAKITRKKLIRK